MKAIKRSILFILITSSIMCLCADSPDWHWFLATKALGAIGLILVLLITPKELWEEK